MWEVDRLRRYKARFQHILSHRRKDISDEAFNQTRPILNLDNNIAERLIATQQGSRLNQLSQANADNDHFVPPAQLMQYIYNTLQED
mgnify:CR=1 FL=1